MQKNQNILYNSCKIYKIYDSEHPEQFYIGSTYNTLKQRFVNHKSDSKTSQSPLYKYIRQVGFDRMVMRLVKTFDEPMTEQELHQKEGVYQRLLHPTLNKNIAGRTAKQYLQENKEKIRQHNRKQKINDEFDMLFTGTVKIVRRKRVNYNIIETPEEQPDLTMTEEEQAAENAIKLTPQEAAEELLEEVVELNDDNYEVIDEADVEYLD